MLVTPLGSPSRVRLQMPFSHSFIHSLICYFTMNWMFWKTCVYLGLLALFGPCVLHRDGKNTLQLPHGAVMHHCSSDACVHWDMSAQWNVDVIKDDLLVLSLFKRQGLKIASLCSWSSPWIPDPLIWVLRLQTCATMPGYNGIFCPHDQPYLEGILFYSSDSRPPLFPRSPLVSTLLGLDLSCLGRLFP